MLLLFGSKGQESFSQHLDVDAENFIHQLGKEKLVV